MNVILPTSYFPPIHYFVSLIHYENIYIELFENYERHSFRNRSSLLGANGILLLTVPVKKKSKTLI